jgi:hypothetical protein
MRSVRTVHQDLESGVPSVLWAHSHEIERASPGLPLTWRGQLARAQDLKTESPCSESNATNVALVGHTSEKCGALGKITIRSCNNAEPTVGLEWETPRLRLRADGRKKASSRRMWTEQSAQRQRCIRWQATREATVRSEPTFPSNRGSGVRNRLFCVCAMNCY